MKRHKEVTRSMIFSMILRAVLLFAGILGILWFLIPYIRYRILNIGNLTGIVIGILLVFIGIFLKKLLHFPYPWITRMLTGVACVLVLLVGILSICMIHAATIPPKDSTTLVVLGCRVKGEKASLMLQERLDATLIYLNEHPDSIAILSGGKGADENISEAECMFRYLTKQGISQERLYKEDQSTSTRENLNYSLSIIHEHQLDPDIAIVTNEFHEYRAHRIAKKLHIKASSIPAKTAWWMFPTYYVRELYGILYEWML